MPGRRVVFGKRGGAELRRRPRLGPAGLKAEEGLDLGDLARAEAELGGPHDALESGRAAARRRWPRSRPGCRSTQATATSAGDRPCCRPMVSSRRTSRRLRDSSGS